MTEKRTALSGAPPRVTSNRVIVLLCFLVGVAEGLEIQSFGVAVTGIRETFDLDAATTGLMASASIFGLIFGALIGGRLADRFGRKSVMTICVFGFALFTLGTAVAPGVNFMLAMRLLTGLALGGAMPNMIAMAAEAGGADGRVGRVSLVVSGAPFGGVLMGLFAASPLAEDWRAIFWFGFVAPCVLLPFLWALLPSGKPAPPPHEAAQAEGLADYRFILFGEGRAWQSAALWISSFSTQLIIYLLLNWLPAMMREIGYSREEAALAITLFNFTGAVGGIVFGQIMRRKVRWPLPLFAYAGIIVALPFLALPGNPAPVAFGLAALLGIGSVGSMLILFGMSAETYETRYRGTGVGVSTAFGRVGSTAGPVLAGVALSAGASASVILPALIPLAVVACGLSVLLARRPQA